MSPKCCKLTCRQVFLIKRFRERKNTQSAVYHCDMVLEFSLIETFQYFFCYKTSVCDTVDSIQPCIMEKASPSVQNNFP